MVGVVHVSVAGEGDMERGDGGVDVAEPHRWPPLRLRARVNATIRTVNWGSIAIAAPLGGWIAHTFGNRIALGVAAAGLLAATAYLAHSPFRQARMPAASSGGDH